MKHHATTHRACQRPRRALPRLEREALLALASILLLASCQPQESPKNVVLIVVDTLRYDHLGSYGYPRETSPALDRFASEGARFEHAYASAPWTKPSIASMFTGLHANSHSVLALEDMLPDSANTLAEELTAAGYRAGAVISQALIGSEYNYQQGFEYFLEDHAQGHLYVSTPAVTEQAIALLDELTLEPRPFFLFVHYFDPHYFYLRHPEYDFAGERPERIRWSGGITGLRNLEPAANAEERRFLIDAYDEEIRFTDAGIGELLDALRDRKLYDDSLIVFTADHGEEFFEHGWLGHSVGITEELVHVPLIIRLPCGEAAGELIKTPTSLVGLSPTILEILGIEPTVRSFREPSFAPLIHEERAAAKGFVPESVYFEVDFERLLESEQMKSFASVHQQAIRVGQFKLVMDEQSEEFKLYDIAEDPKEDHDLSAEKPEIVQSLVLLLRKKMASLAKHRLEPERREITPEETEMLRGLGYVE